MKLSDWLKTTKTKQTDMAKEFGVSKITIWLWAHDKTTPKPKHIKKIIEFTKGAVTANDFLGE